MGCGSATAVPVRGGRRVLVRRPAEWCSRRRRRTGAWHERGARRLDRQRQDQRGVWHPPRKRSLSLGASVHRTSPRALKRAHHAVRVARSFVDATSHTASARTT
eukprot:scaffold4343_cov376-Prasinococcus_capsulatus_cf.AAC.3